MIAAAAFVFEIEAVSVWTRADQEAILRIGSFLPLPSMISTVGAGGGANSAIPRGRDVHVVMLTSRCGRRPNPHFKYAGARCDDEGAMSPAERNECDNLLDSTSCPTLEKRSMRWWFKKRSGSTAATSLRDTLFGDLPISSWAAPPSRRSPAAFQGEPWASFSRVEAEIKVGNEERARELLKMIVAMPGLESRHYLEAWHHLRGLGVIPKVSEAKSVLGVVIDVPVGGGWDVLAAYADHSARYLNHSGTVVIWDHPDERFDAAIDDVLRAAQALASRIGPWEGPRPALSPELARLSLLTPSGLHFGQAPFAALARDVNSAPVVGAATKLLTELTNWAAKPAKSP